jgi:hypothetical protein
LKYLPELRGKTAAGKAGALGPALAPKYDFVVAIGNYELMNSGGNNGELIKATKPLWFTNI